MLVVTAICGLLLTPVAIELARFRREEAAIAELLKRRGGIALAINSTRFARFDGCADPYPTRI